jgi:hypothetical protein
MAAPQVTEMCPSAFARTEFNNLGNAGGSARLHTGSPFDSLLDLARQLFRTCAYVEYRVTVDPAQ